MFTAYRDTKFTYSVLTSGVLYGERLQIAMDRRGEVTGQEVTRRDVAGIAKCSVQNIGMIITNAKDRDQKLGAEAHTAVAAYLRVNPEWLATGLGPMEAPKPLNVPKELTPAAIELAALYDMLPTSDRVARARAFNLATTAIMQVLQSVRATP